MESITENWRARIRAKPGPETTAVAFPKITPSERVEKGQNCTTMVEFQLNVQ
jgi:hypothetical protein